MLNLYIEIAFFKSLYLKDSSIALDYREPPESCHPSRRLISEGKEPAAWVKRFLSVHTTFEIMQFVNCDLHGFYKTGREESAGSSTET